MAGEQSRLKLGEKREFSHGRGWCRPVTVDGVQYTVGVERGQKVRIAFKPRGPQGWGYWWHAFVNDAKEKRIWQAQVDKSIGARGILSAAMLIGDCRAPRSTKMSVDGGFKYNWRVNSGCLTFEEAYKGALPVVEEPVCAVPTFVLPTPDLPEEVRCA